MADGGATGAPGIGTPTSRVDGRVKVTGEARFSADFEGGREPAHSWLVTSAIARGRITNIDERAARAVPGIIEILTWRNVGDKVKPGKTFSERGYMGSSIAPLASDQVQHDGQIVAIVIADGFEAAREAGHRLRIDYEEEPPSATFDSPGTTTGLAHPRPAGQSDDNPRVGDAAAAFAAAPVTVDEHYSTPTQHHNPIELFSTTCAWADGKLTVWESSQNVYGYRFGLADQLGIPASDVNIVSHYVGGAFGSRGSLTQRTALIALAARMVGRPVKLETTRSQGFTIATYRAETRHHIRLGAGRDGKLEALIHEGWEVTSRPDDYEVAGTDASTRLYWCPNIDSNVTIVHADRSTPGFMRSPPEVPYLFALESAMDELACKLDMDPVALRRANDTMKEPIKGLPYTSRGLMRCFDAAAERFGWSRRSPAPGSMREGEWLIGWGCASTMYGTHIGPAAARVTMSPSGAVRVQTASHEIGNGIYTAVALTVADVLDIPLDRIDVELGDSNFPPAPVAGGSNSTASVCNVVAKACRDIKARLAGAKKPAGAIEAYAENVPRGLPPESIRGLYEGHSALVGGARLKDRAEYAFGAQFVEVQVHSRTREVRVPRLVGAYAAGRIVNPKTAVSQLMGGQIWGISSALHEATEIDRRAARYTNADLAEYLIPVNADVPRVETIMLPEEDNEVNELGIKGIGELGNVGLNAAVANAVFHATGIRIRDLPIRLEKLLEA